MCGRARHCLQSVVEQDGNGEPNPELMLAGRNVRRSWVKGFRRCQLEAGIGSDYNVLPMWFRARCRCLFDLNSRFSNGLR